MKKTNIKLIIRSILFFAIFTILLFVASRIFTPKNNTKDSALVTENINGIRGEKEDTIDALVLGDSEAYCSISPMEIWRDQGITAYVCASSGQYIYESYDLLNEVIKEQNLKTVILETNTIYRHFETSKYLFSRGKLVFPLLQYHNRWKSIKPEDFYAPIDYKCTDFRKGYIYHNKIDPASTEGYMRCSDKCRAIKDINRKCFNDIVNVCKKNDIQLILLSTPSTKNWCYEEHNGVQKLADEYGLKYIDMNLLNKELNIDWNIDTKDKGDHMNYFGALKVSGYLGELLKNEYHLTDHRDDDKYKDWQADYYSYSKYIGK